MLGRDRSRRARAQRPHPRRPRRPHAPHGGGEGERLRPRRDRVWAGRAGGRGASQLAVVCVDEGEELRARRDPGADRRPRPHPRRRRRSGSWPPGSSRPRGRAPSSRRSPAPPRRAARPCPSTWSWRPGSTATASLPDALVALAERARALPGIRVEGLFTHFAAAEEGDQRFTRRQFDILRDHCGARPVDPDAPLLRLGQHAARSGDGARPRPRPASRCTATGPPPGAAPRTPSRR